MYPVWLLCSILMAAACIELEYKGPKIVAGLSSLIFFIAFVSSLMATI